MAAFLRERHADATAIYSSGLRRALDTAGAIGAALEIEPCVEADLREYHLGSWEGKTYAELYHELRFFERIRSDPDFAPHGGETPRQVAERLSGALRRIAAAHEGQRVVVVTHGGALTMALGALVDGDYTQWRRVMANCAVSELTIEPEPLLLSFNQVAHLEGL